MLAAIYAIIALQILILLAISYLVLNRWVANRFEHHAERRKHHLEIDALHLLNDPTVTEPLERGLSHRDRKLIEELLLQQAAQLKGADRQNMTSVFEKLGYVKSETQALHSRRWWRRLEAAIKLGTMQSREAVPTLIDAVRDPDENVRLAAVRALGQMNEPRGLQVLLKAMEDKERWTGSSIVEVLVGMGPNIAPEIVTRLESTQNINARRLYVQLCGFLRITAALRPLLPLLKDADEKTRISVARALGQIGDVAVVESLMASLADESWGVRAQAAEALGGLGTNEALGRLKQALSDENWLVRHNAASSLYQLGEEGREVLRDTLRSSEKAPRAAAAQVLAERALGV